MVPAHALMYSVSPMVWITVIIVLIIVFGAAKLPDIARNLGKSAKVLKEELQDLSDDTPQVSQTPQQTAPPAQPAEQPQNPVGEQLPPPAN